MNYLAHARLSFNQPEILVGNMISDFVKGKKQFGYPGMVQQGIRLHRAIDEFTDAHPVTRELKSFFRPKYRLYSGAFGDIVYDHFLANDPNEFADEYKLAEFASNTYRILDNNFLLLPSPFQKMFPFMKTQDWFSNYRLKEGIQKSFGGLVRRAAYLDESDQAFDIFKREYGAMLDCYNRFFPALKKFAADRFQQGLNGDSIIFEKK